MAVSSSNNFTITSNNLVKSALRRIGKDRPSDQDILDGREVLNMIMKHLDAEARWLWAISGTESTITTVASQEFYNVTTDSLDNDIVRLEKVSRINGSNRDPIRIISSDEFLASYERDQTGQPFAVWLEQNPLRASQRIAFLPTPDSAYTINYTYRRALYDFDSASDNPDVPQEGIYELRVLLAAEMANDYGLPLAERQLLRQDAEIAKRKLISFNSSSDADTRKNFRVEYF